MHLSELAANVEITCLLGARLAWDKQD